VVDGVYNMVPENRRPPQHVTQQRRIGRQATGPGVRWISLICSVLCTLSAPHLLHESVDW
jgi:hypothetical protein